MRDFIAGLVVVLVLCAMVIVGLLWIVDSVDQDYINHGGPAGQHAFRQCQIDHNSYKGMDNAWRDHACHVFTGE